MNKMIGKCPICGEPLTVTRMQCRACDTSIEGHFESAGVFDSLSPEQLAFAETFIRCEGKFNRMETELKLSYPTLRTRLSDLLRAMGFEIRQEELPTPPGITEEERRHILDQLASGELKPGDALKMLQGDGS
jgi:hypothetical protein